MKYKNFDMEKISDPDQLRRRYLDLCKKWHPDGKPEAGKEKYEKKMKEIDAEYREIWSEFNQFASHSHARSEDGTAPQEPRRSRFPIKPQYRTAIFNNVMNLVGTGINIIIEKFTEEDKD